MSRGSDGTSGRRDRRRQAAARWARSAAAALAGLALAAPSLAGQDNRREEDRAEPDLLDPWLADADRKSRKALDQLEKDRADLDILAESAREIDPCRLPGGPNFVNFIRRGAAPGEPTYMYGIDLCTRRPFVYQEPTHTGVIVGFDANPPRIEWADDLEDDRNIRGDRFPVEGLFGVEMLFGTATLDYGATSNGSVDFAAAPSVGLRFDRFRVTYAHAVAPYEATWIAKVAITPFRRGPPKDPAPIEPASPANAEARTTWFAPVEEPCNAPGIGLRGVDRFRLGHRTENRDYPVSMVMVSYCARPYRMYDVRTTTDRAWFGQLNNTFPKFALWDPIPRGGVLQNLSISFGYGAVVNDVFNVDFPTNVFYVGLGYAFGDSRWRLEFGRMFPTDELDILSAGVPVNVVTSGWTVQILRALHFDLSDL